jgi:endonuclease/exonuclease/phosphatase (EEP) superfamily protein YafD
MVVAWFGLHLYPGDSWLPVRMGSYFAPWLFMALIPGLAIALLGRRRGLSKLIMLLLLLFVGQYGPVLLPRPAHIYAGAETAELRVMTFNVNLNNRNAEGIAALVQQEQPDLIAFQEMMPELISLLQPRLAASHPYVEVDRSWLLPMALFSRYPLTALPKPAQAVRAQHALVETPAGAVVIWNVHPNPVVRGGWEAQRASFQAVGRGFGFTFPDFSQARSLDLPWYTRPLLAAGPVVRIDHIFASQHFVPRQTSVVPVASGSDHRPVIATLSWRDEVGASN